MRSDWEARAAHSPHWFVDARTRFGPPDPSSFRARGEMDLLRALEVTGHLLSGQERTLEIGCGMGRMTGAIADRVGHVVGVDISERMLNFAKESTRDRPNVSLLRTDGVTLGALADGSFDLVICNAVFQHLPTMGVVEAYTGEVARVLRPNGQALIGLQNWSYWPHRWLRAAAAWIVDYRGFRSLGVYRRTYLGVRLGESDVRSVFSRAGLTIEVYRRLPERRAWVQARR
jgi:SAM-dependent methyltransferase